MQTELTFSPLAKIETELLAVLAADSQTVKGAEAKPVPVLLTADEAITAAIDIEHGDETVTLRSGFVFPCGCGCAGERRVQGWSQ